MTVKPLAVPEISKGYTHVVTLESSDFVGTAGLTKTLEIFPATFIKAGTRVNCVGFWVETAFAGTTTLTLQVGDGVDPDRYATAAVADLKTAGPKSILPTVATQPYSYPAADGVDVLVTATVENLTSLSAGKVHIFLNIIDDSESF